MKSKRWRLGVVILAMVVVFPALILGAAKQLPVQDQPIAFQFIYSPDEVRGEGGAPAYFNDDGLVSFAIPTKIKWKVAPTAGTRLLGALRSTSFGIDKNGDAVVLKDKLSAERRKAPDVIYITDVSPHLAVTDREVLDPVLSIPTKLGTGAKNEWILYFRTLEFSYGFSKIGSVYSLPGKKIPYENGEHFLKKEPYDFLMNEMAQKPALPQYQITYLFLDASLPKSKDFTAKAVEKLLGDKAGSGRFKELVAALKKSNPEVVIGDVSREIFVITGATSKTFVNEFRKPKKK